MRILHLILISSLTSGFLMGGIVWDSAHPILVKEDAHYGRMIRLDHHSLLAGFDFQKSIYGSLSHDEGKTWNPSVLIATTPDGHLTNTEFLKLRNGDILCFFNYRPRKNSVQGYAIRMSRSRDAGKSWNLAETLYTAGKVFGDGCWEPAAIQLPNGEVQVYFANESPYRQSNEQEISMLQSSDNGKSWQIPVTVSFRKNSRDGMPVPVVSHENDFIVVAIEDNGMNGTFKPVIVSGRLSKNGWQDGPIREDSVWRWSAMAKPLSPSTYAGAPYLRQITDGRYILSFQISESGDMKQSRMAVCIGNDRARDFTDISYPFSDHSSGPQLWNSLFIKNAYTITALSETTIHGLHGIWAVDGILKP